MLEFKIKNIQQIQTCSQISLELQPQYEKSCFEAIRDITNTDQVPA